MKTLKKSVRILKCNVYYVTQDVLLFISAVAVGMFNWPMIDLLRNKDESLEWTVPAFKCNQ